MCKKRLPFSQWLKCEIPQLIATSRLQLQVGVAAEPQRHACQLNYSFICNMTLMCAFLRLYVCHRVIGHDIFHLHPALKYGAPFEDVRQV